MQIDDILNEIQQELIKKYSSVEELYKGMSLDEIFREFSKTQNKRNLDTFIKKGYLYSETNYHSPYSVSSIVGYVFYNFGGVIYMPSKDKLYKKYYPNAVIKLLIGSKLHEVVEDFIKDYGIFSVEKWVSTHMGGDKIIGRIDVLLDDANTLNIIELKTSKKTNIDYAKMQLAIYAHMYQKEYGEQKKINAIIISPAGIYKEILTKSKIDKYIEMFIKAKSELKEFLVSKQFMKREEKSYNVNTETIVKPKFW